MAIWLSRLKGWYLVLGGVAVCRRFEPHVQSDLEVFSAKSINIFPGFYVKQ
jgi:hypothetical protein